MNSTDQQIIKCINTKCNEYNLPHCYLCNHENIYCQKDLLPEEIFGNQYLCRYCRLNNNKLCKTCLQSDILNKCVKCSSTFCNNYSNECFHHSINTYFCESCSIISCFKCNKSIGKNNFKCNECNEIFCNNDIINIDISPLTLSKFNKIKTTYISLAKNITKCTKCLKNRSINDIQYMEWKKNIIK